MLDSEVIPLFPLGVVLFPAMPLPLHIFEDRYKQMINYCLQEGKDFGVVYFNGEKIHDHGCLAEIKDLQEEFDDGRINILTQGIRRFSINEIISTEPFITANVSYFDDIPFEVDNEIILTKQKVLELLKEIIDIQIDDEEIPSSGELETELLSFVMAASGGFSMEEKQYFLELCDTRERLEKGVNSLELIIERLKMSREVDKIIKGNGHLLQ